MKKLFIMVIISAISAMAEQVPTYKKTYYPNGKLERVVPYVDGKIHGIEKHYFWDENKYDGWSEYSYKNGFKDGLGISYFNNGQLHSMTTWKNGKRYGVFVRYHESGYVAVIQRIGKDGETIESRMYEDYDGKEKLGIKPNPLKSVGHENKKGNRHGSDITYWRNGKPKWVRIYDDGKEIYSSEYNSSYPGCTSEGIKIEGSGIFNKFKMKIGEQ